MAVAPKSPGLASELVGPIERARVGAVATVSHSISQGVWLSQWPRPKFLCCLHLPLSKPASLLLQQQKVIKVRMKPNLGHSSHNDCDSLSLSPSLSQLVGEAVSESSDEEQPGSAHFPPYKPLQGPSSSTPPPFPIPPPPPAPANRGHPRRGHPPPKRPHRSNASRGGARAKLTSSSSCPPATAAAVTTTSSATEKQPSPLLLPSLASSASNSASDLQLSPLQRKRMYPLKSRPLHNVPLLL